MFFTFYVRYGKLFTFWIISYIFICSEMASEEPIIRDNVSDFSDEDQEHDVHESGEPSNQS